MTRDEAHNDQPLPELYSKTLILLFAIFFSTLFAAALLVINLRNLNKQRAATWVIVFAFTFIILTAVVMQAFQFSPSLTLVANVIGAAILNEYFWNKFIGSNLEFQKKSWIKPMVISVAIVLILFFLLMGNL